MPSNGKKASKSTKSNGINGRHRANGNGKLQNKTKPELLKIIRDLRADIKKLKTGENIFIQLSNRQRAYFDLILVNAAKPIEEQEPEYVLAMRAGYAKSSATHMIANIKKSLNMRKALEQIGFDANSRAIKLLGLINAEETVFYQGKPIANISDNKTRVKALDLAMKSNEDYKPTDIGSEHLPAIIRNFNFSAVPEEIIKIARELANLDGRGEDVEHGAK